MVKEDDLSNKSGKYKKASTRDDYDLKWKQYYSGIESLASPDIFTIPEECLDAQSKCRYLQLFYWSRVNSLNSTFLIRSLSFANNTDTSKGRIGGGFDYEASLITHIRFERRP